MSRRALLIILVLITVRAYSQVSFYKEYKTGSKAEGHAILEQSGNFVVAGISSTNQMDSNYVFMLKTDSVGDTIWTRTYTFKQTLYISSPNALQATMGGGYTLTGSVRDVSQNDSIFILRTDSGGTMLWFKLLAVGTVEIAANSIQPTLDGGSIIGGHYFPLATAQNIFLSKLDSTGNMLWSKGIVVDNDAQATCVRATSDSGFIITGEAARRVYLVKTNKNGVVQWSKIYMGTNPYDIANIVEQTTDGGYIVSGTLTNDTSGVSRMFLLKTNSAGDIQWANTYVGTSEYPVTANGADAIQTKDDGFALTGYTLQPGSDTYYITLIKTDAGGNVMWTRSYGSNSDRNASAMALKQTADDGFIITGKANDAFLIKTDNTGRANCTDTTITIVTESPNFQTLFALIQDSTLTVSQVYFPLKQSRGALVNTVCNPIGIEEVEVDADFLIYPNPAGERFHIIAPAMPLPWHLDLYNAIGEKVYEQNIVTSKETSINCSFLPPGLYFLKATTDRMTFSRKLIIEKIEN